MFIFNQILSRFLSAFVDPSTGNKIYKNLINGFVNSVASKVTSQPETGFPDLYKTGTHSLSMQNFVAGHNSENNVSPHNAHSLMFQKVLGLRGDVKTDSIIFQSLAYILQRITKDLDRNSSSNLHMLNTLTDVPIYMKESYKANLPSFIKIFDYVIQKSEFFKNIIQKTNIKLDRYSQCDFANFINSCTGLTDVRVNDVRYELHSYFIPAKFLVGLSNNTKDHDTHDFQNRYWNAFQEYVSDTLDVGYITKVVTVDNSFGNTANNMRALMTGGIPLTGPGPTDLNALAFSIFKNQGNSYINIVQFFSNIINNSRNTQANINAFNATLTNKSLLLKAGYPEGIITSIGNLDARKVDIDGYNCDSIDTNGTIAKNAKFAEFNAFMSKRLFDRLSTELEDCKNIYNELERNSKYLNETVIIIKRVKVFFDDIDLNDIGDKIINYFNTGIRPGENISALSRDSTANQSAFETFVENVLNSLLPSPTVNGTGGATIALKTFKDIIDRAKNAALADMQATIHLKIADMSADTAIGPGSTATIKKALTDNLGIDILLQYALATIYDKYISGGNADIKTFFDAIDISGILANINALIVGLYAALGGDAIATDNDALTNEFYTRLHTVLTTKNIYGSSKRAAIITSIDGSTLDSLVLERKFHRLYTCTPLIEPFSEKYDAIQPKRIENSKNVKISCTRGTRGYALEYKNYDSSNFTKIRDYEDNTRFLHITDENANKTNGYISIEGLDRFTDKNESSEVFKGKLLSLLDSIIANAYSLSDCCDEVLKELGDTPVYFETYENSIENYQLRNNTEQFMPLSLSLWFLNDNCSLSQSHEMGPTHTLFSGHNLGTNNFKMLYGTRQLLARNMALTYEEIPGVKTILNRHNSSASEKPIEESRYLQFINRLVIGLRFVVNSHGYKRIVAYNSSGVNASDKNDCGLWLLDDKYQFVGDSSLYNKDTDILDLSKKFPLVSNTLNFQERTTSFALNDGKMKKELILQILEDSFQDNSVNKIMKAFYISSEGEKKISRKLERIKVIIDSSINPINVHALMQDIPLANVYNYAYTFETMTASMYGLLMSQVPQLDTEIGTKNELKRTIYEFLRLLRDPFAKVSIANFDHSGGFGNIYNPLFNIFTGDGSLGMGRPKFLSDQLFNKCLLNNIYPDVTGDNEPKSKGYNSKYDKTKSGDTILSYLKDYNYGDILSKDATKHTHTPLVVHKIANGDFTMAPFQKFLALTGFTRFNTNVVRNLFFISNVLRIIRLQINREFTQNRNILKSSHFAISPSVTEYDMMDTNEAFASKYRGARMFNDSIENYEEDEIE